MAPPPAPQLGAGRLPLPGCTAVLQGDLARNPLLMKQALNMKSDTMLIGLLQGGGAEVPSTREGRATPLRDLEPR